MQCPMCYYLYDSEEKIPRNLNCGHTICEQCLAIVYDKKKFLDCPTCRFKHDPQIKPSMLTKNYIALQLAGQKKQIRKNHQFCPLHDEPFKFYCETDNAYICVECIAEHTGHHFVKQDQSFFMTKKALSSEIQKLDEEHKSLAKYEEEYTFVKQELLESYEETTKELDKMFNMIKNKLADEHHRSKEEVRHFLEKEIEEIEMEEEKLLTDIQENRVEQNKMNEFLKKIQNQKKAEEGYSFTQLKLKKHKKPTLVQFPVLVMPFTGNQTFIQICHKVHPKICFFGDRKKLLTFCPEQGNYSLTTINNAEVQYYASACTLPTGEIFITGGGSSNTCFLFSPRDPNNLEKKKSMFNARKEHSCVYLNGRAYVISGYDGKNKGMAGCEEYDIFREEWKVIKGLNTPRCAFAAVVCLGRIYVFGGYDGKERLSSIEVFNPESGKWTLLTTKLMFPLSNAAAVSEGKVIYILGGGWSQGFNQQILQFDTESHQISNYQRMNKGRDLRNKAIKFNKEIYTIGGNCFDGQKLNLRENSWEDLKPYNDLVNDNLDSWCCSLSYNSHEYELQKYQEMSKILQKKYKEPTDIKQEGPEVTS